MKRAASLLLILISVLLLFVSVGGATADLPTCQIFPADNVWNRDISLDPVHPNSDNFIANINSNGADFVHPDFGEDPTYGIPWTTATNATPLLNVDFGDEADDESDPGPYPIPQNAPIEGGNNSDGDRHVIVINEDNCTLYELYSAFPVPDRPDPTDSWTAYSGATFDLSSNALRPAGWTSADAAGLPIFPGLALCDEANSGEINHALRFTVEETRRQYVFPARHYASSNTGANYPPMGMRARLKANYNLSSFTGQSLVIATALKRYGMILADNGSNWYISGETNPSCWDDEDLNQLKDIPGTAFEVVDYVGQGAPSLNYFHPGPPTLSWNRITWAAEYQVQVDANSSFTSPQSYRHPGNSITLPSFTNGIYYWRVRAHSTVGGGGTWGAWSAVGSFTVRP